MLQVTFEILTSKTPHRGGAKKMYQFSRQFMKCPQPFSGGGGVIVLIFWAVHDISRSFEFLTP